VNSATLDINEANRAQPAGEVSGEDRAARVDAEHALVDPDVSYVRVAVHYDVNGPAELLLHQDFERQVGKDLWDQDGVSESNPEPFDLNDLVCPQPGIVRHDFSSAVAIVAVAPAGEYRNSDTLLEPVENVDDMHVTRVHDQVDPRCRRIDAEKSVVHLRPKLGARLGNVSVRDEPDSHRSRPAADSKSFLGIMCQYLLSPSAPVGESQSLRGKPRPRSAMMLRWISLVPPMIVSETDDR
jgi:hypothetical protein